MDFLGDVGQVQRLLDRGIAATDHRDHLVAVEEAVTGGAGGYAATGERFFGGQAEILRRSACCDDQRIAGVDAAVTAQGERALLQLGCMNVIEDDLGVEALGVFLHAHHQIRAGQAFNVARPVVDLGGGGQLAAGLDAGDHQWLQVGAGSVYRSGITGRARAEDDQTRMLDFTHKKPS